MIKWIRALSMMMTAILSANIYAGSITSSGGEKFVDERNPWFVSPNPVTYCIDFDPENISADMKHLRRSVKDALETWQIVLENFAKEGFAEAQQVGGTKLRIAREFTEEPSCSPETKLQFLFGKRTPEVERVLAVSAATTIAVAIRTHYDSRKPELTKGIIFVNADKGPHRRTDIKAGVWSSYHVEGVLEHELGHTFGFQHEHGSMMAEDYPAKLAADEEKSFILPFEIHSKGWFQFKKGLCGRPNYRHDQKIHPEFVEALAVNNDSAIAKICLGPKPMVGDSKRFVVQFRDKDDQLLGGELAFSSGWFDPHLNQFENQNVYGYFKNNAGEFVRTETPFFPLNGRVDITGTLNGLPTRIVVSNQRGAIKADMVVFYKERWISQQVGGEIILDVDRFSRLNVESLLLPREVADEETKPDDTESNAGLAAFKGTTWTQKWKGATLAEVTIDKDGKATFYFALDRQPTLIEKLVYEPIGGPGRDPALVSCVKGNCLRLWVDGKNCLRQIRDDDAKLSKEDYREKMHGWTDGDPSRMTLGIAFYTECYRQN